MHLKNFLKWIGIKVKLDSLESPVPYVSRGQIWWASLGENVGFEINGKNEFFTRPVIIYRKLAHGFYFVIPTTTIFMIEEMSPAISGGVAGKSRK